LDSGRLIEADALLDQAREVELAALRQARELEQKAHEAEDRHALNAAKLVAGRGNIALTQVHYVDAADHFKQGTALVPSGHPDQIARYPHRQAYALCRERRTGRQRRPETFDRNLAPRFTAASAR